MLADCLEIVVAEFLARKREIVANHWRFAPGRLGREGKIKHLIGTRVLIRCGNQRIAEAQALLGKPADIVEVGDVELDLAVELCQQPIGVGLVCAKKLSSRANSSG